MLDVTDEVSAQLQCDLHRSIEGAYTARRPILTHLNADTTWLLRIPYPPQYTRPPGRCRFNVLVDPWLKGPQSDVAGWFSTQWHVIKSSVQSIEELDLILKDAENEELKAEGSAADPEPEKPIETYIDLVAISHEFTDHCHKATLLEVEPHVPVFATTKAAELISSWSHFETVLDMPTFGQKCDWRTTSVPPLPEWLGVSRLITQADALYYHSAVVLSLQLPNSSEAEAEAIIYTPHGVHAETFSAFESAHPRVTALAFLHGLHDVSITLTKQLNLGALNALKAQRILRSRYWVGTHDEVKKGGGILAPFLRRKAYTLQDAIAHELKLVAKDTHSGERFPAKPSYAELGSGESLLLR